MDRYIVITFYSTRKRKKQILVISVFLISVIKTTIPKFQMKKDWVNQIEIKPILIKKISTKFFIPSDYAEKDFIRISLYFSPIKKYQHKIFKYKHLYRNIQIIPKPDAYYKHRASVFQNHNQIPNLFSVISI